MRINIIDLKHFKENFDNLKINTPDGFQEIGELYHKPKKKCYSVSFSNGDIIECSEDHLFQLQNNEWVKTKDIKENDITLDGFIVLGVISIGIHDTYDLEVLHENHRYYSDGIVSHNSGKTILGLSAAMKLLDTKKDKYDKIVYIRKTVVSDTEELGYLPGDLSEKMSGYLAPLYSNLEYIIDKKYNNKKNKLTKEELDAKIEDTVSKYGIQFMYEGHLRGGNIRNAVVIFDEIQNDSISSAKTVITRIGDNCKLFALGSNRQIDSKFLNKHNNALTFLINRIGEDNMNVQVTGCNLNKTVKRGIIEKKPGEFLSEEA